MSLGPPSKLSPSSKSRVCQCAPCDRRDRRLVAGSADSDARLTAEQGTDAGTRCLPTLGARALDLSGISDGPGFIGLGLEAVRRVRQFAAILRGDLPKHGETSAQPAVERDDASHHLGR